MAKTTQIQDKVKFRVIRNRSQLTRVSIVAMIKILAVSEITATLVNK